MVGDATTFDGVLELCRDQYRRIILAVLASEPRALTLNDLTKTIVKHNHQASITEIANEEINQIQLSLHHLHIPKLEQCGVIEYDPDRQLVEPTAQFDEWEPLISTIVQADPAFDTPVEL